MSAQSDLKAFAGDYQTVLDDLKYHADAMAALMSDLHGGYYNVVVNHDTCLVMVVRILERRA